ncbi:MAG TPA: DinB family protein [Saprospiraceae bacterium]|nr:DinB family protein [Saprospiraceae bacterium]HMQ84870.1 DinB family protein [Saprospiraceae bacterium]
MLSHFQIADQLQRNALVFQNLLSGHDDSAYLWKPAPEKWSLLEIIGHLCDEEVEDFRARVQHVLEQPNQPMPPINPTGWVEERHYAQQDVHLQLNRFLLERKKSVDWLNSLDKPKWENTYEHAQLGAISARRFLHNWLAHDYLHIRQINRYLYTYFYTLSGEDWSYAGDW